MRHLAKKIELKKSEIKQIDDEKQKKIQEFNEIE